MSRRCGRGGEGGKECPVPDDGGAVRPSVPGQRSISLRRNYANSRLTFIEAERVVSRFL